MRARTLGSRQNRLHCAGDSQTRSSVNALAIRMRGFIGIKPIALTELTIINTIT